MENRNVTLLIAAFVALIVGISLIGVIASEEQKVTKQASITSETVTYAACRCAPAAEPCLNQTKIGCNVTLAEAPDQWRKDNGCSITAFSLKNVTGDTMAANTDYILDAYNGVVNIRNSTSMNPIQAGNSSTVAYSYCADDYLTQSWTRSVMDIVVGFFALALLIIAVALFYSVLRNEGLLNI